MFTDAFLKNANRKLDMLGIDIDGWEIYKLLKTYIKARLLFPKEVIKTQISKSRTGFHIEIYVEHTVLDNIAYRCFLGDDPVRIKLSIMKMCMNKDECYVDLLFNEKCIDFDIEEILGKEAIEDLMDDLTYDKIGKYAKVLNMELEKYRAKHWVLFVNFRGVDVEKIREICEDIALKDEKFRYRISESTMPDYEYCIKIICESKDEAHKKGMWFVKKVFKENEALYFVKEM